MRNQRNGGFKVKHALQILLVLAVCFWLLYRAKHSHDREMGLEGKNKKVSTAVDDIHSDSDVLRFGRKDLPQVAVETITEGRKDIDNDGNEEAGGEAENNLEEGDKEGDKGMGEDGIDEKHREGEGADGGGHGEESGEDEQKEVKSDEQGLSTSQKQDSEEANSQGAREEHYRGDDASSAVVLNTETSESNFRNNNEEKTENIEKDPNVNNKTLSSDDGLKVNEDGVLSGTSETHLFNNTSKNRTSSLDGEHVSEFQANLTLIDHDNQVINHDNSTVEPLIAEMQSNSSETVDAQTKGSFLPQSTIVMVSDHDQNSTAEVVNGTEEGFNSIDDGSSKPQKILNEQTVNFNSTDGPEKVEEGSTIYSTTKMGGTSEGDHAVQLESDDPLDKLVMVKEERNTSTDLSSMAETETKTNIEEGAAK